MFVFKSTYLKLVREKVQLEYKISDLKTQLRKQAWEWNKLVNLINQKGGHEFLRYGEIPSRTRTKIEFEDSDLKKLLFLCHPDKHQNSEIATQITQKLLELRKK